jgi:hypothetical protein
VITLFTYTPQQRKGLNMNIPSIKTIMRLTDFGHRPLDIDKAKHIRSIMCMADAHLCADQSLMSHPRTKGQIIRGALASINAILDGCGVERIEPGNNKRSPGIDYVNMGDTYADTVMVIRGRFRVGCWGDVVERGNYA